MEKKPQDGDMWEKRKTRKKIIYRWLCTYKYSK